jgi:ABC-type lipoprotein export system ATPase subunit
MAEATTPIYDSAALACRGVWKVFQRGRLVVKALSDLSMQVNECEIVALTGPSGSGKSTLLNLLGALDLPTRGETYGLGIRYLDLSNDGRNRFRRYNIGFVFQELRLISHLTATQNVMLPKLFDAIPVVPLRNTALSLLDSVGLAARADHFPYELSYGEQQRVAIARAVITTPKIILADEPTANLDNKNADLVINIIHNLRTQGATIVMATHDERLAKSADRVLRIEGGILEACTV